MKTLACHLLLCGLMQAASVSFDIHLDTSSLAGTGGNVYFSFIAGNSGVDPLEARITAFAIGGGGTLSALYLTTGSSSGVLPGTVTMSNAPGLNDYLHALTFGSGLFFTVTLEGTAIQNPASLATAGTTFAFSLDDGMNILLDENLRGAAGLLNVGTAGHVTGTVNTAALEIASVPEPATWWIAGSVLVLLVRRRSAHTA